MPTAARGLRAALLAASAALSLAAAPSAGGSAAAPAPALAGDRGSSGGGSWGHQLPAAPAAGSSAAPAAPPPPAPPASGDGGAFGSWRTDAQRLPYFSYELDQTSGRGAAIAAAYANATTFPTVRNATDHTFLFGNDRVTALASNYGYTQLRQDEGAPKLLNDVNRSDSQFGATNGIVSDARTGEVLASTWSAVEGERAFGVGYRKVRSRSAGCKASQRCVELEHLAFAPKGDAPVLLSAATLTNAGTAPLSLVYSEAHSAAMLQLDFYSWMVSQIPGGKPGALGDRRLFAATHYAQSFERLEGGGLAEHSRWLGLTDEDQHTFRRLQVELGAARLLRSL